MAMFYRFQWVDHVLSWIGGHDGVISHGLNIHAGPFEGIGDAAVLPEAPHCTETHGECPAPNGSRGNFAFQAD